MNSSSIWDDSEWTVEDEYNSPTSAQKMNETTHFKNTLSENKGEALYLKKKHRSEVKGQQSRTVKIKSWSPIKNSKVSKLETNNSFENSAFKTGKAWQWGFEGDSFSKCMLLENNEKPWNEVWKQMQQLSSSKILSEMRSVGY